MSTQTHYRRVDAAEFEEHAASFSRYEIAARSQGLIVGRPSGDYIVEVLGPDREGLPGRYLGATLDELHHSTLPHVVDAERVLPDGRIERVKAAELTAEELEDAVDADYGRRSAEDVEAEREARRAERRAERVAERRALRQAERQAARQAVRTAARTEARQARRAEQRAAEAAGEPIPPDLTDAELEAIAQAAVEAMAESPEPTDAALEAEVEAEAPTPLAPAKNLPPNRWA